MLSKSRVLLLFAGLALSGLVLTGCDLEGISMDYLASALDAGDNTPDSGDSSDDSSSGGSDSDDDSGSTVISRFSGTWLASYGDDVASSATSLGVNEYAVRMTLVQNDTSISGSGQMIRVFREGSAATDTVNISVTGTASDDDATISMTASPSSKFDFTPVWYLRLSGNRMVGMYFASDVNDNVARSGHAIWHRAGTVDIGGSWVAGFSDVFPRTGTDKKDRTVSMALERTTDDELTGNGTMVLQREGDVPDVKDFDLTYGVVSESGVDFTLGAWDLADNLMDHFGYTTEGYILTTYAQFDASEQMEQNGHATFYSSPTPSTTLYDKVWVTSFCDSAPVDTAANYLIVLDLQVSNDNVVTGTAQVLDESEDSPEYTTYQVQNGTIIGTQLEMDLVGATVFEWDLRLANSILVGSYQQLTSGGEYISRGSAEWRTGTTTTLTGSWVASFYDTDFASSSPNSQLAIVTITSVTTDGTISGVGTLRIAGERSRRSYNVTGTVSNNQITWIWSGSDLFGNTVWHLRKAGGSIFGTYTNLTSGGAMEFRGNARFIRTNQD